jgi:type VI secretion system secreted protein Hcp
MASNIFAKFEGIKGESTDDKHKDEIEVLSYTWGVTNASSAAGGGAAAGKTTFQDLLIVHKVDKASPLLMRACATGAHLKDATLTVRKAGGGQLDYLIVKLENVRVTSVMTSGETGQAPSESITLDFSKIEVAYKPVKADGSLDAAVPFKYDMKTNKGG